MFLAVTIYQAHESWVVCSASRNRGFHVYYTVHEARGFTLFNAVRAWNDKRSPELNEEIRCIVLVIVPACSTMRGSILAVFSASWPLIASEKDGKEGAGSNEWVPK